MQGFTARLLPVCQWLTLLLPLLMVTGPAPADIAVSLVAVLFLVHSQFTHDWKWLRTDWLKWLLVMWAYMVVRDLFIPNGGDTVLFTLTLLRFPIFAMALITWVLRDEMTREKMWNCLLIAVLLLVVDSFYQYFHRIDLVGRPAPNELRLSGPFSNPRVGLTVTWFALPVLAAMYDRYKSGWRLLVAGALTTAVLAMVYISGERMAFLLLIAGLGGIMLVSRHAWRNLPLAGVLTAIALAVLSHHSSLLAYRQVSVTKSEVGGFWNTVYGRTFTSAWDIGQAHPIIGIGSKQFQKECIKPQYGPTDEASLIQRCPQHAHNHYLELLVEYGAIGVLLFVGFLFSWYRNLLPHWRLIRENGLVLGLFAMTGIWLWPISVSSSQFVPWAAIPFWLFMAWLTTLTTLDKKKA